jgi:hypothetical protein
MRKQITKIRRTKLLLTNRVRAVASLTTFVRSVMTVSRLSLEVLMSKIFWCAGGHIHRSKESAVKCGWCKRAAAKRRKAAHDRYVANINKGRSSNFTIKFHPGGMEAFGG